MKPCETKSWGSGEYVVLREHPMRNKVFQEPDSSDFEMGGKQKTPELKVQGFPI